MKRALLIVVLVLLAAAPAGAATVNVAWDHGQPSGLGGTYLYVAPATGVLPNVTCGAWSLNATVAYPANTGTLTVADGKWCSRASHFNTAWPTPVEGGYSNTLYFQVPAVPAPTSVPGAYRLAP